MDRETSYARTPLERFLLEKLVNPSINYGRPIIRDFLSQIGGYDVVIDIGAGVGKDLSAARELRRSARCIAVEHHPPYAKTLREHGYEVVDVDLERQRLPVADGSIDVVIANQVMEHVKEVFWIVHEISRVLRVGGHFIVGVPNLASLHNRLLLLAGFQPTVIQNNSAHLRGYTRRDFLAFLESGFPGGYSLVKRRGSNFYPFPPLIAKPLARMIPSLAWGMFLLLKKQNEYNGSFVRYPLEARLETPFFLGSTE